MRIIQIQSNATGAHAYQSVDKLTKLPSGWAIIPEDMETPNLPYGDIEIEETCGIPTVTKWTPREMPVVDVVPEAEAEPTAQEDTDTMLVDHEYRLTLLELGV